MTDAEARQALADACKQVETNLPLYTYQCQNHSSVNNIYPGCCLLYTSVVDKVRVHLVLQHPVFQLLLAAFVLHPADHQAVHVFSQLVDAPADIAQLVVPLHLSLIHIWVAPAIWPFMSVRAASALHV